MDPQTEILLDKSLFRKEAILLGLHAHLAKFFFEIHDLDELHWLVRIEPKDGRPIDHDTTKMVTNSILQRQAQLDLEPYLSDLRSRIVAAAFPQTDRR